MKKGLILTVFILALASGVYFMNRNSAQEHDEKAGYLGEMDALKRQNKGYEEDIQSLLIEVEGLKSRHERIMAYMDNTKEFEVTHDAIYYRQSSDYFSTSIFGHNFESNEEIYALALENIHDFCVSNDGQYNAVLIFDGKNTEEQRVLIFNNAKDKLYEFTTADYREKANPAEYIGTEIISFYGFSKASKYLWGSLPHALDVGVYFSIDMTDGVLNVYGAENNEVYRALLDEYPFVK